MNVVDKVKELKRKEAEEIAEHERQIIAAQEIRKQSVKQLYNSFVELIKPFDNQTIGDKKITLKFKDKENVVQMFINKRSFVTFEALVNRHDCNCSECHEGFTGHRSDFTYDLEVHTAYPDAAKQWVSFPWYKKNSEDEFAEAMKSLLDEHTRYYEWRKFEGIDD